MSSSLSVRWLIALGILSLLLSGCGSQTPAQTARDQALFKGSPMPPAVRRQMQAAMEQAKQRANNHP